MALPTYPATQPAPSNNIKMLERGQLQYFFTNLTTTGAPSAVAGYGNTLGAPAGSVVYGIPCAKAYEGDMQDYTLVVDAYGATATQGPSAIVTVYGSMDNVQFYALTTLGTVVTQGAIYSLAKLVTPGFKVRYITAAVTTYGGSGGTTDSVSCGIIGG